jgi:hypothetical protein
LQFNNGSGYNTVWSDLVGCTTSWVPITITIPSTYLVANFQFQFVATAGNLNGDLYPVGVDEIVIQTPSPLSASATAAGVKCNGGNTGAATAVPCGGAAPYTYAWSNAQTSATISGLSMGTYSVTITDSCGNSSTASVSITQPAGMNVVKTSTIDNSTCNGTAKVTVSGGTPPYTYLWSPNNQTTDSIGSQCAGTYCCTITDNNGCVDSSCVIITLTTGLSAVNNSSDIDIYPDPNNGQFTIQWLVGGEQWSVEIYNILGEKIYSSFNIQNPTFNVNLSNQPNGMYLIRILNKDGSLVEQKKIVKTN